MRVRTGRFQSDTGIRPVVKSNPYGLAPERFHASRRSGSHVSLAFPGVVGCRVRCTVETLLFGSALPDIESSGLFV